MNRFGMVLPDYGGGSIVNLMSSIARACGVTDLPYATAPLLEPAELGAAVNIVLMVVDGLGLDYLERRGRGGALHSRLRGSLTSVFPSTTASAIPTYLTGLAPRQHGLTGWHMYFEEVDGIAAVLPLTARGNVPLPFTAEELPQKLFSYQPLSARIGRQAHVVSPTRICDTPFNRYHTAGATRWPYQTRNELFDRLADLVSAPERKFVHAYYPTIDTLAHQHGIDSPQVAEVFAAFEGLFEQFLDRARGSDTVVIATADHGFIDAPPDRLIVLDDHPELSSMLLRPLCGERRAAYAYVKTERRDAFQDYVETRLGHATTLFSGRELVEDGWFGPGATHPRLLSRIGDFVLVMKDDWTIKDWVPEEKRYPQIGVHGGISAVEMVVPVVIARI